MKHNTTRLSLAHILTTGVISFLSLQVHAQTIEPATNTDEYEVQVCNTFLCGAGNETSVQTLPACINADMMTAADMSVAGNLTFYLDPAFVGMTPGPSGPIVVSMDEVYAIAFSNINGGKSGVYISEKTLDVGLFKGVTIPIPYYWGPTANEPANDVDVAIGNHIIYPSPSEYVNRQYILVVYESHGNIFLEKYDIWASTTFGGMSVYPPDPYNPPPFTIMPSLSSVRIQLDNGPEGMGRASKPHIDLYHYTAQISWPNDEIYSDQWAVTWQEEDIDTPGQYNVWGIDGTAGAGTPSKNTAFIISEDGMHADVNAFTATAPPFPVPGTMQAYTSYINNDGDKLYVSRWGYGAASVNKTTLLNQSNTVSANSFSYPRIGGPMFYDYGGGMLDPECVVVVNSNNSGRNAVDAYRLYPSAVSTTPIETPNITDYSGTSTGSGFDAGGNEAIMPVVSGIGARMANAAGWGVVRDYPSLFYSELMTSTGGGGGGSIGDVYAFGNKMDPSMPEPEQESSTDYWEVNYQPKNGMPYNIMPGTQPALALAVSNNTGYEMLSVFYSGDDPANQRILFKFNTGSPYSFKPGRPAGVENTTNKGFAVYPNPVTDVLNIAQANGASYNVTDALGRTLHNGMLEGDKAQVNTTALTPGMHILTISKDGRTEKVKFVKQ